MNDFEKVAAITRDILNGEVDVMTVKLAEDLVYTQIDFIQMIAGANLNNLEAATRLAEEFLPDVDGFFS